ncbi:hypothetical protein MMPV_006393 [Pyropia vietnamensis]
MAAFVSCVGAALTPHRRGVAACDARSSTFLGPAVSARVATPGAPSMPGVVVATASRDLPIDAQTNKPLVEVAITDGSTMTQSSRADGWLESVRGFQSTSSSSSSLTGAAAATVQALGAEADHVLSTLPPPLREESWRFTDLNALYKMRFGAAAAGSDADVAADAARSPTAASLSGAVMADAAATVVFVDGVYRPELSTVGASMGETGVYVGTLGGYEGDASDTLLELLSAKSCETDVSLNVFTALNGAAVAAGSTEVGVVVVPAGVAVDGAVQVLFSTTPGGTKETSTAAFPRLLVVAGANASVDVVEQYMGTEVGAGVGAGATAATGAAAAAVGAAAASHFFSDSLTTVHVGDGARVRHTLVNEVPVDAVALSHVYARTFKDATYELLTLVATGAVGRVTIGAELLAPGGHVDSTSLCLSDGKQVNDLHSRIAHSAPLCTSNQLHKNVAAGRGRSIFAGKVVVDKVAQKTDSKQLCRSLLLSNRAQVDAMPVLLINADDVKCTHGATVSDLNEDELFYCQSRGLSATDARFLLIKGFAGEVVDKVRYEPIQERTTELVRMILDNIDLRDSQFATHSSI